MNNSVSPFHDSKNVRRFIPHGYVRGIRFVLLCRCAARLTETARGHSRRPADGAVSSLRGNRFAALEPSAGEHLAAVAGLHALTEPVDLAALPLLGLKSTKHVLHLFPYRLGKRFACRSPRLHFPSAYDYIRDSSSLSRKSSRPKNRKIPSYNMLHTVRLSATIVEKFKLFRLFYSVAKTKSICYHIYGCKKRIGSVGRLFSYTGLLSTNLSTFFPSFQHIPHGKECQPEETNEIRLCRMAKLPAGASRFDDPDQLFHLDRTHGFHLHQGQHPCASGAGRNGQKHAEKHL
jgi:hypothetical protein